MTDTNYMPADRRLDDYTVEPVALAWRVGRLTRKALSEHPNIRLGWKDHSTAGT